MINCGIVEALGFEIYIRIPIALVFHFFSEASIPRMCLYTICESKEAISDLRNKIISSLNLHTNIDQLRCLQTFKVYPALQT